MAQLMIILLAGVVMVRDELGRPPLWRSLHTWGAAAATLVPMLLIAVATDLTLRLLRRRIERTGSIAAVGLAEQVVAASRWAALVWHAAAVLLLGWLDAVRRLVGDWVLVDEAIALLPPLLVMAAGWWSQHPIELMVRESTIMRNLDEGAPVHAPPSRGAWVLMMVRNNLVLMLAPVVALMAWSEAIRTVLGGLVERGNAPTMRIDSSYDRVAAWLHDTGQGPNLMAGLQLVGVVGVFVVMPAAMRVIWDTLPLGAGVLRDRLLSMCGAHGVRVRAVLVWRTHATIANGAVIGLIGRLRFVLLTDLLLERLAEREVEAVMAHELGHVRRGHMVWLAVALVACIGGATAALSGLGRLGLLAAGTSRRAVEGWAGGGVEVTASVAGLALGLMLFGWVSRRFEWQADAFGAQHLSGLVTGPGAGGQEGVLVTPEAAESMANALRRVARINHMDPRRFSWRHGSIARRIANLHALVGRPAAEVPVDAAVRAIKWGTAGVAALLILAGAMGWIA